jgi:hypothetical protein
MAYYSGQASSYDELLTVLVNGCVANGWVWADSILRKNGCYIKLEVVTSGSATGIKATGGTGVSGTSLLNAATTIPRMGNPGVINLITFPVLYHLFVFDNEVYLKIKFNVNTFHYLAFGKSDLTLSENGLWISATACGAGSYSNSTGGVLISDTTGGAGGGVNPSAVAPFWNTNSFVDNWSNAVIAHGFDGVIWSSGTKIANFVSSLAPLNARQPSSWSNDSIFLPINIYVDRASSKKSLACQLQNSRYLRVDNFNPEQIIQLGSDKWMIFPFYKKDITSRNGGGFIDHTGTFGWAIRYDGP